MLRLNFLCELFVLLGILDKLALGEGTSTNPPENTLPPDTSIPTQLHTAVPYGEGPPWRFARNVRGIAYKPIPSDITPNATSLIPDSDMYNTDFEAIWGIDSDPRVTSRNDLVTLVSQGFNSLHLYDWNPAADQRQHLSFLDRCHALGIGVWIPLSNYLFLDAYDDRYQFCLNVIKSVTDSNGNIHPAVYGWMIANEYDLQDFIDIDNIIEIITIMSDYDPSPNRPFCIPTSTQEDYFGIHTSGLGAIVELHDKLPENIFFNRLMHGTNPFMAFAAVQEKIFEPYLAKFEEWGQPPIPLLLTEMGRSGGDVTSEAQVTELTGLAQGFIGMMNGTIPNPYNFAGYFLFEYTQESWREKSEKFYGMNELGENISPVKPKTKFLYGGGGEYQVEELKPVEAFESFVDAICEGVKTLDKEAMKNWDNLENSCKPKNQIVVPGDNTNNGNGGGGGGGSGGLSNGVLVIVIILAIIVVGGLFCILYMWSRRRNFAKNQQERLINSGDENSLRTIPPEKRMSTSSF